MITRRRFVSLPAIAAAARAIAPLIPKSAPVPVLYGDGRHDDTAALNAWGAGSPVVWSDGREVGSTISNGMFLITATLVLTRTDPCALIGNMFNHRGPPLTWQPRGLEA